MRFIVVDTVVALCVVFVWLAVFNELYETGQENFLSGGALTLLVFACAWRVVLSARVVLNARRVRRGD